MKDLIVITGCTQEGGTLAEYRQQLLEAGITLHVEPLADLPFTYGLPGNLGYRLDHQERLLQQFHDWEYVVFTDAWDVTFYGDKAGVLCKIPRHYVLHGAEKGCSPDFDGSYHRNIQGDTPWRFANGGLSAGRTGVYLDWIRRIREHEAYDPEMVDQELLYKLQVEKSPLAVIDAETELFFCLIHGYEELGWLGGRPYNCWTNTIPNFIHANGQTDTRKLKRDRDKSVGVLTPGW